MSHNIPSFAENEVCSRTFAEDETRGKEVLVLHTLIRLLRGCGRLSRISRFGRIQELLGGVK